MKLRRLDLRYKIIFIRMHSFPSLHRLSNVTYRLVELPHRLSLHVRSHQFLSRICVWRMTVWWSYRELILSRCGPMRVHMCTFAFWINVAAYGYRHGHYKVKHSKAMVTRSQLHRCILHSGLVLLETSSPSHQYTHAIPRINLPELCHCHKG